MKIVVLLIVLFIVVLVMSFDANLFYIIAAVIGGFALILWLIHDTVKSAVKDALREYDEEKAKKNGPQ